MKNKVSSRLTKLLMMCMLMMSFSTLTFAADPSPSPSPSSATGFDKEAIDFVIKEDGSFSIMTNGQAQQSTVNVFESLYSKFRVFCAGATGLTILTVMLTMIIAFASLAIHSNNSNERTRISAGLAYKIIAAAGVVAVPMIIGLASNLFV